MAHFDSLISLEWDDFFLRSFIETSYERELAENKVAGRVISHERDRYALGFGDGLAGSAILRGRVRFESLEGSGELPVIGDWVIAEASGDQFAIEAVLKRKSYFARTAPDGRIQGIAANIDSVFIASSMNRDFSLNRLDRYIALVQEAGASPVILLTKCDLVDEASEFIESVRRRHRAIEVFAVSSLSPETLQPLQGRLISGRSVAVVGSSGVGKSTLINSLIGEDHLRRASIRDEDSKGRHTTTSRSMHKVAAGGWIIDTPGMREIQMLGDETGAGSIFADISALEKSCRFGDCAHLSEPGCAVKSALTSGDLDLGRWESYQKLNKEMAHQARKHDQRLASEEKEKWKKIHRDAEARSAMKKKGQW